ncbi:MAG: hypothetical protein IPK20_06650 [Betaproteobacteria bacterium]|nr:hypothetical protein [Betaproteobacteria bacterium]
MKADKPKGKKAAAGLVVVGAGEMKPEDAKALTVLRPSLQAAFTLKQANAREMGDLDLQALADALAQQAQQVCDGDLGRLEGMLATQASTLDALFGVLTRRAILNMGEHIDATETYLRLAFKAQSQARATVEALGELKHPKPVAFVQQANIANGPQQVNNGVDSRSNTRAGAHARKNKNPQNQLSGCTNELRQDTRAPSIAGGTNPAVEAVGEVDGAQDGREGPGRHVGDTKGRTTNY